VSEEWNLPLAPCVSEGKKTSEEKERKKQIREELDLAIYQGGFVLKVVKLQIHIIGASNLSSTIIW
jgi:hypothetical protein